MKLQEHAFAEAERKRREDEIWNAAIEAAIGVASYYADLDYCAAGYPEDGGIAASGTAYSIGREIDLLKRITP